MTYFEKVSISECALCVLIQNVVGTENLTEGEEKAFRSHLKLAHSLEV